MINQEELVAKWAREKLLCSPLSSDAASAMQVWDATVALRESLVDNPVDVADIVTAWDEDSFHGKMPLTHNIPAYNQVRAAVADLKTRLPLPPAQPAPIYNKENDQ